MKSHYFAVIVVVTFLLTGAGCMKNTPSLEDRLTTYEAERKVCVQERRDSFDLSYKGQSAEWDEYEQQKAEYACSTVDLAKKYYAEDPEGIVELCVRTEQIGNYTYEKGLGGAFTKSELDQLHQAGTFADVTMDERGMVTIGDDTLENWRGLCRDVIENVVSP